MMARYFSETEWAALPEAEKAKVRAAASAERAEADEGLAALTGAISSKGMTFVKTSKAGAAALAKFLVNPRGRDLTVQAAVLYSGSAAELSEVFYAGVEPAWKVVLEAVRRAGYRPDRSLRWWGDNSFQSALRAGITRPEWEQAVAALPPLVKKTAVVAATLEEWLARRQARAGQVEESEEKSPADFLRDLLASCEPVVTTPTAVQPAAGRGDPFDELNRELGGGTTVPPAAPRATDSLEAEMAALLMGEPPAKPDEQAILLAQLTELEKQGGRVGKAAAMLAAALRGDPTKGIAPRPAAEVRGLAQKLALPGFEAAAAS